MIAADQIRKAILDMAKKKGMHNLFTLEEVARELDLVNWEELMEPVNLVAEVLILQGFLQRQGNMVSLAVGAERLP